MYNSEMKEIISLLNFAQEQIENAKDDLTTYDDDSDAAHEDGQYVGRVDAYKEVIKECGRRLQNV